MRNTRLNASPRRQRRRSAFTLIEVLLVLLILGILATVAIVNLSGTRDKAKIDTTKLMLSEIENALDRYNFDIGHYPNEEEGGLNALLTKPSFSDEKLGEKWSGPYLKKEARDPWNNPIKYEKIDTSGGEAGAKQYHLWSLGPSGQDGAPDNIKNWDDNATPSR